MPDDRDLPVDFPLKGIDRTREYQEQPPGSTAMGINVRGTDPFARRGRGGSRPGLSKYVEGRLNAWTADSEIQMLNFIVRDSADALLTAEEPGPDTPVIENPQIPGTLIRDGGSGAQPNANTTQAANPNPVPNWFIAEVISSSGGGIFSVQFAGGTTGATIIVDGDPVIPVGATVLLIKRNNTYAVQPVNWVS